MKTLNKKLYRDVKLNKSQFITIFLMVFLGIFAFAGIHSYMDGMKISADKYYDQNNFQDIWLTGENFSEDDLNSVKKIENIKDAERQLTINTLYKEKELDLQTNFIVLYSLFSSEMSCICFNSISYFSVNTSNSGIKSAKFSFVFTSNSIIS